ncbi:hypothetical protein HMPREF1562_3221 [Providencia alcalifaciens F90-2004]|uniref:Uncharacterized protein n=2 Tax=Providencia alcalifaciens TaxID=126385 RepID=B6XCK6_9GAMM|nr:hypothetical protein PROVALCAL_01071 [Providencia alcalifaciens DSM 30120]ETT07193.1 hypothetical protein HMPREF1562_3221 [Providencia alcalifaciens F90-2004]EUD09028.1 hypothetical protein HMPREF1563_3678 [Providencia alcalifaciens 205/92]
MKKKKLCGGKSRAVTQNKHFAHPMGICVRYITKITDGKKNLNNFQVYHIYKSH